MLRRELPLQPARRAVRGPLAAHREEDGGARAAPQRQVLELALPPDGGGAALVAREVVERLSVVESVRAAAAAALAAARLGLRRLAAAVLHALREHEPWRLSEGQWYSMGSTNHGEKPAFR